MLQNQRNRFMLLPPRVGKVLRANSQALAPARDVKALGAAPATEDTDSVTERERKREGGDLPDFSLVFNASLNRSEHEPIKVIGVRRQRDRAGENLSDIRCSEI